MYQGCGCCQNHFINTALNCGPTLIFDTSEVVSPMCNSICAFHTMHSIVNTDVDHINFAPKFSNKLQNHASRIAPPSDECRPLCTPACFAAAHDVMRLAALRACTYHRSADGTEQQWHHVHGTSTLQSLHPRLAFMKAGVSLYLIIYKYTPDESRDSSEDNLQPHTRLCCKNLCSVLQLAASCS